MITQIKVEPPKPRQVARSVQVHYEEIHFVTEGATNLNSHAGRMAIEDRSNG